RFQPPPGGPPPGAGEEGGDARLPVPPSGRILRRLEGDHRHPRSEAQPMKFMKFAFLLAFASPAAAQLHVDVTAEGAEDMVVAVPVMPTDHPVDTVAGTTAALGRQVAEVVAGDLRGSGLFRPVGPSGVREIGY